MAANTQIKAELKKTLESLIADAIAQNDAHESSRQLLYRTLAGAYVWWLKANKINGFFDELYNEYNLRTRGNEENFTRLIRLVWQIDWGGRKAPVIQTWSRALKKLDHEYNSNKQLYQGNIVNGLVQLIKSKNGLKGLIGQQQQQIDEVGDELFVSRKGSRKNESDVINDKKIQAKHLELGQRSFDKAKSIQEFRNSKLSIATSTSGYAVALIRKGAGATYKILSISNDQSLIDSTIVATYKRSEGSAPLLLRTLCEVIETQSLPSALEKYRAILAEPSKFLAVDGKKMRQIKRILILPKSKEILLSESRTACSVVTLAKLKNFPVSISKPLFLRTENHKFIEQEIIQSNNLCFHTTLSENIEKVKDEEITASHRIRVKNNVTNRIKNLFFYEFTKELGEQGSQAYFSEKKRVFNWTAQATSEWFRYVDVEFVSQWLPEYGQRINRPDNKLIKIKSSKRDFCLSFSGTRDRFSKTVSLGNTPKISPTAKPIALLFQSKDLIPVLHSLANQEIFGAVSMSANDEVLIFKYSTKLASYLVAVPTANFRARRVQTDFEFYGAKNGN